MTAMRLAFALLLFSTSAFGVTPRELEALEEVVRRSERAPLPCSDDGGTSEAPSVIRAAQQVLRAHERVGGRGARPLDHLRVDALLWRMLDLAEVRSRALDGCCFDCSRPWPTTDEGLREHVVRTARAALDGPAPARRARACSALPESLRREAWPSPIPTEWQRCQNRPRIIPPKPEALVRLLHPELPPDSQAIVYDFQRRRVVQDARPSQENNFGHALIELKWTRVEFHERHDGLWVLLLWSPVRRGVSSWYELALLSPDVRARTRELWELPHCNRETNVAFISAFDRLPQGPAHIGVRRTCRVDFKLGCEDQEHVDVFRLEGTVLRHVWTTLVGHCNRAKDLEAGTPECLEACPTGRREEALLVPRVESDGAVRVVKVNRKSRAKAEFGPMPDGGFGGASDPLPR